MVIVQVPPPYTHKPSDAQFYMRDPTDNRMKPNPELLKDHLFNEGRLTEDQALFILEAATEVMSREPNMVNLTGPITGTTAALCRVT
jgi:serine/threonine-protein phosphatase 2B catalytic subunit